MQRDTYFEELAYLYRSPGIVRIMKFMKIQKEETRNTYRNFMGKDLERCSLGKNRKKWEENNRKVACGTGRWIEQTQDQLQCQTFVLLVLNHWVC
jgi:hypothetical protein